MLRVLLTGMLLLLLLIVMLPGRTTVTMPKQNLSELTAQQWTGLFATITGLPLIQRVAHWADLAASGTSYVLGPLGEGHGHPPSTGPLYDFAHVDCVTYLEQVYALALAHSYAEFPSMLQHIRYRDSRIDFRWRNHYTVSDWLPANDWFIHDVTATMGAGVLHTMAKTISRAQFFAAHKLTQYGDIPDESASTNYIPRDKVHTILGKLHTGDMVIFVIDTPGIIAGHVGLIRVQHGTVYLQHAGQLAKTVVTLPLLDYLKSAPKRTVGCKFARLIEK